MTRQGQEKRTGAWEERKVAPTRRGELVREIFSLSGSDALNRILGLENPQQMVRGMARVDFYWLIKKIGEDDALPLLRMASPDQWQYLLDMELWQKDRLDLKQTSTWLNRFLEADPARLARWMIGEGESLAHFYFFKNIEVEVRQKDEAYDLTDEYVSFDNIIFFRILDKEHEETIKHILQHLAGRDYERYQALLLGLAGVLPAEQEEEMYRLAKVRLAEEGFLPYEEAVSVYGFLKPGSLLGEPRSLERPPADEEDVALVPLTPLIHAQGNNLLTESTKRSTDPVFLDRIRLEFAGLCNQILSADKVGVNDIETLLGVCRKAAGYINLGLEKVSDGNVSVSEMFLRNNPLISIFRVGFGLALQLQWDTRRWLEKAWFSAQGFNSDFWDEEWGGTLAGLLQKRPRLFRGSQMDEPYKEFENVSEVDECRNAVRQVSVLDRLLEILASEHPLEKRWIEDPHFTFYGLIFNLWARARLKLDPGFSPLSMEQVRELFRLLRPKRGKPPYRMPGFGKIFVGHLMAYASDFEPDAARLLKETLSVLWQKFVDEYAWVGAAELDGRFMKFILTSPSFEVSPS